ASLVHLVSSVESSLVDVARACGLHDPIMEVAMPRLMPIVLLFGSISGASCASPTIPTPLRDEPAHTRGTITEYDASAGSTFLVEARPDLDSGDKYYVRLDSRTEIFRQTA